MAGPRRPTIRGAVLDYLEMHRPEVVDREAFWQIRKHVAAVLQRPEPPSRRYILDILLETDIAVDRAIGGFPVGLRGKVRTGDAESAKRSLLAMAAEYSKLADAAGKGDVRRAVLHTKNHIKLALARSMSPGKREVKQEIYEWLLVWLENPGIFEAWLAARESRSSGR